MMASKHSFEGTHWSADSLRLLFFRFLAEAQPVLIRIRGVRLLWSDVEQLRAESYSQDNKEHENLLLEVRNGCEDFLAHV